MTSKLTHGVVTDDPWNETRAEICPAGRKEHSHLDELFLNFLELHAKQDALPYKITLAHWNDV
jgi:hypothetical protein